VAETFPGVSVAQLTAAAPSGDPQIIKAIADASSAVFAKYGLTSRNRVLGFLSTALEESGGLRLLVENLNYSAERAAEVWPSRFPTAAAAAPFAHNPPALADKVYGGRMGNTAPGDGWKFRGRGLIQITGHDNYAALAKETGLPFVDRPDLVNDPAHLLECAVALFVRFPGILGHCDRGEWTAVWALVGTGRADGPVINLPAHNGALARLSSAIPALAVTPVTAPATSWWGRLWACLWARFAPGSRA
jgi:putative chitinase